MDAHDKYASIEYYRHETDGIFALFDWHEFNRETQTYFLIDGLKEIKYNYLFKCKRMYKNNKLLKELKSELINLGYKHVR